MLVIKSLSIISCWCSGSMSCLVLAASDRDLPLPCLIRVILFELVDCHIVEELAAYCFWKGIHCMFQKYELFETIRNTMNST